MIDSFSDDGMGWAQFSDDREMRFRFARSFTTSRLRIVNGIVVDLVRVTFLMLNPSLADAFRVDPTVHECRKRAIAMDADALEVVNLFAFRSPYPAELEKRAHGERGDGPTNNAAILAACTGAQMVIAAWGNHGGLGGRATIVQRMLAEHGIKLYHLGLTGSGAPKHPLARGKHRIPADQQPVLWTP